jgi:hypothetical protein
MADAPSTDPGFKFKGHPEIETLEAVQVAAPSDPLGPLARLVGDGAEAARTASSS